jgi:hypothetical protein
MRELLEIGERFKQIPSTQDLFRIAFEETLQQYVAAHPRDLATANLGKDLHNLRDRVFDEKRKKYRIVTRDHREMMISESEEESAEKLYKQLQEAAKPVAIEKAKMEPFVGRYYGVNGRDRCPDCGEFVGTSVTTFTGICATTPCNSRRINISVSRSTMKRERIRIGRRIRILSQRPTWSSIGSIAIQTSRRFP